jgi:ATP-binding cassette subfamily B protein
LNLKELLQSWQPAAAAGSAAPRRVGSVFRYGRHALELAWTTNRTLSLVLAALTVAAGMAPAGIAWVGAHIVDAVVGAIRGYPSQGAVSYRPVLGYVGLEALLVALLAAAQRGLSTCQSLLRAQLGQRVNVMILDKALTLELEHFEDSEFYDKLTRARREASSRPLSMVMRTYGLAQNAVSLASYGAILVRRSRSRSSRSRGCRRSSPRRNSRAMRFDCSAGARPRPGCSCTSRRCWHARTTPRRSSCSASGRCCCSATATSTASCTARTGS